MGQGAAMTDEKPSDQTPPEGVLSSLDARPAGRRPSVRRPQSPRRRGPSGLAVVIVVVLILAAGGWWYLNHDAGGDLPVDFSGGQTEVTESVVVAGDRAVVLVFPEWDATGYVTEERKIPSRDRPGEDLAGLMKVLCKGPRISGAVSAMPRGTRALAAFFNPDDQSVVLDFSQELVTAHPGGSAAEVATLTSILRTVALNFPGTHSCVILVEGAQVETLAGHLDLVRSFDPRRWL